MSWIRRYLPPASAAAVVVLLALVSNPAQGGGDEVRVHHTHVNVHPFQQHVDDKDPKVVEGAKAMLVTTKAGAHAMLSTVGLKPGHVYTMWFAVISDPTTCKTSPCSIKDFLEHTDITKPDMGYGDGLIAGEDGTGTFTGFMPVGQLRQNWWGNGFQNPLSAEIHLLLHEHGVLIPEMAETMLGSYRGGCKTESLFEGFPKFTHSHGEPGPNICRLMQVVFFVQDKR